MGTEVITLRAQATRSEEQYPSSLTYTAPMADPSSPTYLSRENPIAAYHVAGPHKPRDARPSLLPLAASSDLHGYTQRPEPSFSISTRRPSPYVLTRRDPAKDIRIPLGYPSDLPPDEDPMSAHNFARLPSAAASSDLRRRLRSCSGRRRRQAGLPLPIDRATMPADWEYPAYSMVHAILEDIVHYTLSTLHYIQKSLRYWESIAEGTKLQRMYFMIFERGPRAFLETTWRTLTGLRSRSPSEYLLNSADYMVSTRLDALRGMQNCLAVFLAEVYSEVDNCKGRLTEWWSEESLRTLLNTLEPLLSNLELSLGTRSFQVKRLSVVEVNTETAISLIYQNLLMVDTFISNQLEVLQKPRNKTIYWLPYTCGAIGLSACSLWLLRHSSLMGRSDMDGSVRDSKESVAGYWDQHAVELIISIRDGLYKTFKRTNKLVSTKQDVHQIEASLHRCEKELMYLPQKPPSRELALAMPTNQIQKHAHYIQKKLLELDRSLKENKLGQQEAMLELTKILEGNEIKLSICAAWPAFGLCLLLLLLLRASVFNDQDDEERSKKSRLPQRLLLRDAELRLMEFHKYRTTNGMEKYADSMFGLMLFDLDRLYKALEFHAKKSGEWSRVRKDLGNLAKPHMRMSDRLVVLSRLKETYYCLLPSPSPAVFNYRPPSGSSSRC